MPPASFIPDRQLTFSPDLAATIGLEEAVLMQFLGPLLPRDSAQWHLLQYQELSQQFPFWTHDQIKRVLASLETLGIIALSGHHNDTGIQIAAAGSTKQTGTQPTSANPSTGNQPIDWVPTEAVFEMLQMNHGIDRQFAIRQLQDFDVGTLEHSRDSRFRQHVLAAWRHHQRHHQAFDVSTPPPFDQDWQPSLDAMEIMARSGVDEEFIDSVRPEFILYWRERGGPPREVNSKFIGWVRSRWTRFQAGLGHSTEPRPMTAGWQPSEQVFEVLAMSGIERDYALGRLPEFRVFWCDAGELQTSWNSKFLQHVKHQWRWDQGRQHDNDQRRGSAGDKRRTRDLGIADILGNTGWAD